MTTKRLRGAFLYTDYYIVRTGVGYCVVYPVWRGNAKAQGARMGKETDTYAFFVS